MRHRSRLREWTEDALALVALYSLAWTPGPVSESRARASRRVPHGAIPRLRRVALRNLESAMPEAGRDERARITDGVFRSIARLLVSFARFPSITGANVSDWI